MAGKKLSTCEKVILLDQAKVLGVTAACKTAGVSRPTYYKWLRRFETQGESGLDARSTAPLSRNGEVLAENQLLAKAYIEKFSGESARQVSLQIWRAGRKVSARTVQRIRRRKHQSVLPDEVTADVSLDAVITYLFGEKFDEANICSPAATVPACQTPIYDSAAKLIS